VNVESRHIRMVMGLRRARVADARVLAAMERVDRALFVPEAWRAQAYDDRPLPIGDGQTISQPYMVAVMAELLDLRSSEKVLEIGTGSGYHAAVLARLAAEVFSVEILPPLGERAKELLDRLGSANVEIKIDDGFYGWDEKAPFDAILMTAAAPRVPAPLWRQLREGGRLVMPLGAPRRTQKLVRIRKVAGKQVMEVVTDVIFVPLTGAIQKAPR